MRQPHRIESLTLKGIGVFENTHFDFPPAESALRDAGKAEIHIFTGPNGCGKSTVLYALAAIFDSHTAEPLIKNRFVSDTSCVGFNFASGNGIYTLRELREQEGEYALIAGACGLRYYGDEKYINLTERYSRHYDKFARINQVQFPYAAFAYSGSRSLHGQFRVNAIVDINDSPFDKALSFENTCRASLLAQWIANNITKAALSKLDNAAEEEKYYQFALRKIADFIFEICEVSIEFKLQRHPLAVAFLLDGCEMTFDSLPEGLKSIIHWVSDLALRLEDIPFTQKREIFSQPIILFLDEVDIHLHPKWQRRILPAIQKLLPNAQVFVSTHSPFVVGSLEDAWVYRLPDPQRHMLRDASVPEEIVPTESGAGKSIQLILEEVFDVGERFDIETEKLLASFKLARNGYLQNPADDTALMSLADKLRARGEELEMIIEMELRQIARRLSK
ncbi:hypothetical protein PRCB_09950 [Pantoea rodasii]|uniref:Uncharacterized protein n=2 Tax=Pantoea rodasii TaxID=1076549 RepID=A0A2M9WDR5_9GAMM|nr:ATP-binding protein [Pantoea rodasii]PJZ05693.1 hypothetical protein PRCB_09950 [Pantoea rodasii]